MTTAVLITLIICATLVIISIVSAIGKAHERKEVIKQIDDFKKAFPNFEEQNSENNYFKKF